MTAGHYCGRGGESDTGYNPQGILRVYQTAGRTGKPVSIIKVNVQTVFVLPFAADFNCFSFTDGGNIVQ